MTVRLRSSTFSALVVAVSLLCVMGLASATDADAGRGGGFRWGNLAPSHFGFEQSAKRWRSNKRVARNLELFGGWPTSRRVHHRRDGRDGRRGHRFDHWRHDGGWRWGWDWDWDDREEEDDDEEPVPDTTPPTLPANAHATDVTRSRATIVWNPSNDDTAVDRYEVLVDGQSVGTTVTTALAISLTCDTTVSVIVLAFDTSGNSAVGQPFNLSAAPCFDITGPTGEPTGPTGEPTGPTDEPTGPTDEPTGPTDEPTGPTDEPTGPTDEPTGPTGEPTGPTGEPTGPSGEPTGPTGEPTDPVPTGVPGDWNLDFRDEFDGPGLNPLVWAPWRIEGQSSTAPFNPAIEDADYKPENVTVFGGNLILSINQEPAGGPYPYSSGMVQSGPGLRFFRGFIEARIKVDACAGCWPAFWMLDEPTPSLLYSETDVVEFFDTLADRSPYFNFHWDANAGQQGIVRYGDSATDYTGAFHTYGLNWTASGLQVFIDGQPGPSFTDVAKLPAVANYILFNLAVQKGKAPPDGSQMMIDYVRVWSAARDGDTV
ncbi:MAG: family 16 glycosylhydrolase [Solirubrobacterales bacterium]